MLNGVLKVVHLKIHFSFVSDLITMKLKWLMQIQMRYTLVAQNRNITFFQSNFTFYKWCVT